MSRRLRPCAAVFAGAFTTAALLDLRGEEGSGAPPAGDPLAIPIAPVFREAPIDFGKDVLPVLKKNCLACHHRAEAKGGLVLETPQTMAAGGKRGPAVVAGKGAESLLLAVASQSRRPAMPPRGNALGIPPLTPAELGLLKMWIDQGALGEVVQAPNEAIAWHALSPAATAIYAAALAPAGDLAACGRGDQVHVYRLPAGALAARLSDPGLAGRGIGPGAAHAGEVCALAFDPRGELLASGGFRSVKLWRRPHGARRLELTGIGSPVTVLAAAPRGEPPAEERVAAGTADGRIIFWDLASGRTDRALAAHTAAITGLCFSPEGNRLVSSSLDRSVAVWEGAGGFPASRLGTEAPVNALAVAAKGALAVAGLADGTVLVWTPAAPAPPRVLGKHEKPVTALAAVPGAEMQVLSAGEDGALRLWDLEGGKELKQLSHGAPVTALAAFPGGQLVAAAGADGVTKYWDLAAGKETLAFKGGGEARARAERRARAAAYLEGVAGAVKGGLAEAEKKVAEAEKKAAETKSGLEKLVADQAASAEKEAATGKSPDELKKAKRQADRARKEAEDAAGDAVLALRAAGEAREKAGTVVERMGAALDRARAERETAEKEAAAAERPARALVFSPERQEVLAAMEDGAIRGHGVPGGAAGVRIDGLAGPVPALAWVPGRGLVSGSAAGAVLWDLDPPWALERVVGAIDDPSLFTDRVLALDWSPDGKLLAAGGGEPSRAGELKVIRVEDGAIAREFPDPHTDSVLGVEFSPDGRLLATASADKFVKVFEVESGKLVKAFEGHTNQVLGVTWRSDGSLLASAGADNAVKVWNLESGEQRRTIGGFGKQVAGIEFIAWSSSVASVSADGTVRVHNAESGAGEKNLGAGGYLHALAVIPGGGLIAAGGHEGKLFIWDGKEGKALHTIEPPGAGK